jgi:K(+)-stimulated pyrophosphate-energized sodium pump
MDITDPMVVIGLFLGGVVPLWAGAMTMTSVGKAASDMVTEIRRQFKEIPGLLEGTGKPDTTRCVEISTKAALREMIMPGLLAVVAPVVVGFFLVLRLWVECSLEPHFWCSARSSYVQRWWCLG